MVRLDVGPPPSLWAAWLGCLIPVIVLLNVALGVVAWLFLTSSEVGVVGALLLLPLLIVDALVAVLLIQHYRSTFWLDGRILIRRVIPGRRNYDLAAAHISTESALPMWTAWRGGVLPCLVVRVPGRAPVKLWLRDPARRGARLPPDQLAVLARAIDPGLWHPVARRLWELASDPLRDVI